MVYRAQEVTSTPVHGSPGDRFWLQGVYQTPGSGPGRRWPLFWRGWRERPSQLLVLNCTLAQCPPKSVSFSKHGLPAASLTRGKCGWGCHDWYCLVTFHQNCGGQERGEKGGVRGGNREGMGIGERRERGEGKGEGEVKRERRELMCSCSHT